MSSQKENLVLRERLRIISNISRLTDKDFKVDPILEGLAEDEGMCDNEINEVIKRVKEFLPEEDRDKFTMTISCMTINRLNEYAESIEEASKKIKQSVNRRRELPEGYDPDNDPEVSPRRGKFLDLRTEETPNLVTAETLRNDLLKK